MSENLDQDPELDRILRRLPYPKAPVTLTPSVLARLAGERQQVWWRRPLLSWPLAARVLGVSWLFALALGVAYFAGGLSAESPLWLSESTSSGGASSVFGLLTLSLQVISSLGAAAEACLAVVPMTVWWLLGGGLAIIYLSCLAVGTLIYRRMFPHHS
jgi:hypothetical protein